MKVSTAKAYIKKRKKENPLSSVMANIEVSFPEFQFL